MKKLLLILLLFFPVHGAWGELKFLEKLIKKDPDWVFFDCYPKLTSKHQAFDFIEREGEFTLGPNKGGFQIWHTTKNMKEEYRNSLAYKWAEQKKQFPTKVDINNLDFQGYLPFEIKDFCESNNAKIKKRISQEVFYIACNKEIDNSKLDWTKLRKLYKVPDDKILYDDVTWPFDAGLSHKKQYYRARFSVDRRTGEFTFAKIVSDVTKNYWRQWYFGGVCKKTEPAL